NIRWGIDAHPRASFGFTPFPENAWRTGLSQLLLGYALPGDSATLFSSILPHPHIEGQLAQTLGHFVHFTEQLFLHTSNLSSPRPLATWSLDLRATLLALFSSDDSFADDLRPVTNAILSLSKIASLADLDSPIPFPIIRAALADAFADSQSSRGFLAGSVTFSGLKPMRSIPFPVICLLGLNDGAFPRRDHPSSFDLIASQPRRGDRSLRDDDRYLFLESILSARQFLYLSYTGISTKDNSPLPPSVLVTELFEHLKSRFSLPDDFITKHKLQAFNSAYFNHSHPQLFSFSTENATTAQTAANQRSLPPPFIPHPPPPPHPLPAPPEETLHILLTQLLKFFANPSKFFLEESLHLRLHSPDSPPHDSEPSSLNHLEKYKLRDDLASRSLANGHLSADLAVASASGQLPIGYAGASAYDAITQEVATLLARISTPFAETILPPIPVDLSLGRFHLTGSLPNLRPSGLFAYRVGSLRPVDKITAWISHLILQFVAPPHHPRISTFFAKKDEISFAPVPLPEPPLPSLLE
ncbi:MAG: exodeoxyribonuclease V subunit gamma, partial [Verrucomicrobia bacterium]|nr:exodeoxyribonuclease V subunit gamma [Verrucomicrobiota bacterium]